MHRFAIPFWGQGAGASPFAVRADQNFFTKSGNEHLECFFAVLFCFLSQRTTCSYNAHALPRISQIFVMSSQEHPKPGRTGLNTKTSHRAFGTPPPRNNVGRFENHPTGSPASRLPWGGARRNRANEPRVLVNGECLAPARILRFCVLVLWATQALPKSEQRKEGARSEPWAQVDWKFQCLPWCCWASSAESPQMVRGSWQGVEI